MPVTRWVFEETRKNPSAESRSRNAERLVVGPIHCHQKTAFKQFSLPYTHGRTLFKFSPPLRPPREAVFQVLHTTLALKSKLNCWREIRELKLMLTTERTSTHLRNRSFYIVVRRRRFAIVWKNSCQSHKSNVLLSFVVLIVKFGRLN